MYTNRALPERLDKQGSQPTRFDPLSATLTPPPAPANNHAVSATLVPDARWRSSVSPPSPHSCKKKNDVNKSEQSQSTWQPLPAPQLNPAKRKSFPGRGETAIREVAKEKEKDLR